jgi:hypothetical protein
MLLLLLLLLLAAASRAPMFLFAFPLPSWFCSCRFFFKKILLLLASCFLLAVPACVPWGPGPRPRNP